MVLIRRFLLRRQRQKQRLRILRRQQRQNLHEHPLILCAPVNDGGGGAKVPCYGCLLPLSGVTYNCKQCEFFLHKVCAELPNKIIHFLHPKHPLTLFPETPYNSISIRVESEAMRNFPTCDNCRETVWGFDYRCSVCDFDLCIQCVLLQQIVKHEGHKHSFKLYKPESFPCDACGEISYDMCICTTCLLLVHHSCASLPPTIKHVGHDHPLSFFHSVQPNDPMDHLCKVCGKDVNTYYWCYYCPSCNYIVHLDCVTFEAKLGDERNELGSASTSVPNECTVVLISNDLNEISLTKIDNDHVNEVRLTQIERVKDLQHSSHQHSLTLSDIEPDSEEICDGCVQTISAPFYKCAQCNFFLHVSCAELPNNIQHLLHHHSLTLFFILPSNITIFCCRACHQWCNGFAYSCKNCDFKIDLKCSSVSGTLRHESHEHTLSLDQKLYGSNCNACGLLCEIKFRCEACDFNLDLQCAALPSSVRHKWDKHPLKLTFSMIEDKRLGKYYCDFCEERRDNLNHWFYYCEDCDVAVHPQCLLGKHRMLKFGRTYQSWFCPHVVSLVINTRQPLRSCDDCDHEIHEDEDMFLFECADCNLHDHLS